MGKRFADENRLRIAEKDKALEDARHAYDELSRKLQQSSQQVQGEVLELELESILRNAFPMDQLDPVPKGLRGADVIHKCAFPLRRAVWDHRMGSQADKGVE